MHHYKGASENVAELYQQIIDLQDKLQLEPMSNTIKRHDQLLLEDYGRFCSIKHSILRQRAKVKFLNEGYKNSAYFHVVTK